MLVVVLTNSADDDDGFFSATFVYVASRTNSSLNVRHWPSAACTVTYRARSCGFNVCEGDVASTTTGATDAANCNVVTVADEPMEAIDDAPSGAKSVINPEPDVIAVENPPSMRLT